MKQGEDTTAPRSITGKVMLTMVPNLMRALGYYPSEAEVTDMMTELQSEAEELGLSEPTHVDFDRFIALYTNHRPVFGIGKDQLGVRRTPTFFISNSSDKHALQS